MKLPHKQQGMTLLMALIMLIVLTLLALSSFNLTQANMQVVTNMQQRDAVNGDIVAAMLDSEATVKVFKQRDGHTWLLPRNSSFEPILGDEAEVLGKVVAVLRAV